ncbi:MAG: helix-turn-helix transcriptional regulator [Haliscomenobacter sp.]
MTNKLRIYRAIKEVSQQELADRMEVSRQTINAIENNKYSPSLLLGLKLAHFLGCAVDELFQLEDNEKG